MNVLSPDLTNKELYDGVSFKPLTRAVTLHPCRHKLNDDTVRKILATDNLCPFDRKPIEGFVPDLEIRQRAAKLEVKALAISSTYSEAKDLLDCIVSNPPPSPPLDLPKPSFSLPRPTSQKKDPSEKEEYIQALLNLLEKPEIANNIPLHSLFKEQCEGLIERDEEDLNTVEKSCLKWVRKLFINERISQFVAEKILSFTQKAEKETFDSPPSGSRIESAEFPHQILLALKQNDLYSLMTDKKISKDKLSKIPINLFSIAIQAEPSNAILYVNAARALPNEKSHIIANSSSLTRQQLCLKALYLDPESGMTYSLLAGTILPGESIRLLDGNMMDQQQLYFKGMVLEPHNASIYRDFARTLPAYKNVTLPDGSIMNSEQLVFKATGIELWGPSFGK